MSLSNFSKDQLIKGLDALSTVDVLRLIVFLYECLDVNHGEARILFMIEALLRRVKADTASGMRSDLD